MIPGEKVLLRPIEKDDLTHIHKWRNDPKVLRFISPGVPNPTTMANLENWHEHLQGDRGRKVLLICTATDETPLGLIGIFNIAVRSQKGELFIFLGETDYWGQGFGREALILFLDYCFRVQNLRRIALEVYEYNQRAIACYEKIGFIKEGYVRRSVFKDGAYHGEYILALFKDQFYQLHHLPSWREQ